MALAVLLSAGLVAGFLLFNKPGAVHPAAPSAVRSAPVASAVPLAPVPNVKPTPAAAVTRLQRAARIIRVADAIAGTPGAHHVPTKAEEPLPDVPAPLPLPPDFLEKMVDKTGKVASFKLPGGGTALGAVELVQRDTDGNLSLVQGHLSDPSPGFFFFVREEAPGVAGAFSGNARFDNSLIAYRAEPSRPGRRTRCSFARRVDQVMCLGMPLKKNVAADGTIENAPQTYPTNAPAPVYNNNVVSLQSLPGAKAVVYLDFNGGPGPWLGWGNFACPAFRRHQRANPRRVAARGGGLPGIQHQHHDGHPGVSGGPGQQPSARHGHADHHRPRPARAACRTKEFVQRGRRTT